MSNDLISKNICRDLYVLEDENNPKSSEFETVAPSTILDQVYDDQSPTRKNLRQILEELRQEIITGGRGNIKFPVTSVNGMMDDIILTKKHIGLGNVDNTRDIDKPLSSPQRNTVMEILNNYDFKINLNDLYSHLMNTDNPHDVSLKHINKNEELSKFINHYIGLHNTSQHNTVHPDIRGSLRRLWALVEDMNKNIKYRIDNVLELFDDHMENTNSHINLFNKKEDLTNKVMDFISPSNVNHDKYPSTRAVVEFVANKLVEFNETLPDVKHWIEDIKVINIREDLPIASNIYFHKAYLIRYGISSHPEIAFCRLNPDKNTYDWDFTYLGSYSKYDENYFTDTTNGLSIRMDKVVEAILGEDGALERSITDIMKDYYTSKEIDEFNFINEIKMLPGTTDGTIRFYTDGDMRTMSDDIRVTGLQRLAFLEWINEDQIWDNAIHERHILSKAVARKHLQDKAVGKENIECPIGSILGNDKNSNSTVDYITLEALADYLRPLIGGWPDPNVPGGNPWYDRLSIQLMQTHNWLPGVEYSFGNGGYCIRFTGTISCLANMDHKLQLSENLTTESGFQLVDAGGGWMYQSSPDVEWTVMGGSNITGHTFATVTMDKKGLYLETISVGDRIDAPFDIWVKYVKNKDLDKYPALPPNENI